MICTFTKEKNIVPVTLSPPKLLKDSFGLFVFWCGRVLKRNVGFQFGAVFSPAFTAQAINTDSVRSLSVYFVQSELMQVPLSFPF